MERRREEILEASYQLTKLLVELCGFYRVDKNNRVQDIKNKSFLHIKKLRSSVIFPVRVFKDKIKTPKPTYFLAPLAKEYQGSETQQWLFFHLERVCAYLTKKIVLNIIKNYFLSGSKLNNQRNKSTIKFDIKTFQYLEEIPVSSYLSIPFCARTKTLSIQAKTVSVLQEMLEPTRTEKLLAIYKTIFDKKLYQEFALGHQYKKEVEIKEFLETETKLKVILDILSELQKWSHFTNHKLPLKELQDHLSQIKTYCDNLLWVNSPSVDIYRIDRDFSFIGKGGCEYSYNNTYDSDVPTFYYNEKRIFNSNNLLLTNFHQRVKRQNFEADVRFLKKQNMPIDNCTIPQTPQTVHQLEKKDLKTQKKDDISAYVADVISNYYPQALRDINAEMHVIAKDKIEMRLLMTLQDDKERQKWLPGIQKNEAFFSYKGVAVNLNEHLYNQKALLQIATKYNYSLPHEVPQGYILEKRFTTLYGIINGCVDKNNVLDDDLIHKTLATKFDIDENNIYAPVAIPDYSNWQPSDDVNIFYKFIDPNCNFISFKSKNGSLLYGLIRIPDGNKCLLLPVTNWVKDNENPASFFVMPQGKAPLLNLDFIYSQNAKIILTEELELAYKHGTECAASGFIWTSWYGGKRAMKNVDWKVLEGREVYCFFKENDENLKDKLSVLMKLFKIFSNFEQTYLNILCVDPNGNYRKVKHKDFVAYAQKQQVYIPKEIKELHTGYVEFGREEKHETKYVVDGIIREKSLTMIYAPSGIGKTWLSMSIAQALAKGNDIFEGWENSYGSRGVGIFFGEMDKHGIDNRGTDIRYLHIGDIENLLSPPPKNLELSKPEGQKVIDNHINTFNNEHDVKMSVLILDNLNTLAPKATSQAGWSSFFKWIEEKKKQGITVILIHHPNKEGKYFGSSHILNTVDLMIHAADKDQIKTKLIKIFKDKEKIIEESLKSILAKDITMFLLYDKERYGYTGDINTCKISLKNLGTDQVYWEVESPDYESFLNEYNYSLDDFSQVAMDELATGEFPKQYSPKKTDISTPNTYPTGKAFEKLELEEQGKIIENIWVNKQKAIGKSISATKLATLLGVSRSKVDSIRKNTQTQVNDFKAKYPEYFNSDYYQSNPSDE